MVFIFTNTLYNVKLSNATEECDGKLKISRIFQDFSDFLKKKQDEGKITYLFSDIPKSFILMRDGTVYVVEHSSRILRKRFELI